MLDSPPDEKRAAAFDYPPIIAAIGKFLKSWADSGKTAIINISSQSWFIAVLCMLAWITVFGTGVSVNSQERLKNVSDNFSLGSLAIAVLAYAHTNIAFLAIFSGALGGILSKLEVDSRKGKDGGASLAPISPTSLAYRTEPPIASALRSFAVYLLYIAGFSIGLVSNSAGGPPTTDAQQYIGLAGFLSAVGFTAGYDPTIFTNLLDRFRQTSTGIAQAAQPVQNVANQSGDQKAGGGT